METKTQEEVQSRDGNKHRRVGTPLHLQPANKEKLGKHLCLVGKG